MILNDIYDLAGEVVHVEDDPAPEPVPLEQHFGEDLAPPSRRMAQGGRLMAVERCRFDHKGGHLYTAEHCPHQATRDEEGPIAPRGWTVQHP
jgi:hypothetical protein